MIISKHYVGRFLDRVLVDSSKLQQVIPAGKRLDTATSRTLSDTKLLFVDSDDQKRIPTAIAGQPKFEPHETPQDVGSLAAWYDKRCAQGSLTENQQITYLNTVLCSLRASDGHHRQEAFFAVVSEHDNTGILDAMIREVRLSIGKRFRRRRRRFRLYLIRPFLFASTDRTERSHQNNHLHTNDH
jgi:hypothetical protein